MKPSQTVPVPDFSKRYVYNDVMVLVVFFNDIVTAIYTCCDNIALFIYYLFIAKSIFIFYLFIYNWL